MTARHEGANEDEQEDANEGENEDQMTVKTKDSDENEEDEDSDENSDNDENKDCPTVDCSPLKPESSRCYYRPSSEKDDNGCQKHPCGKLVCRSCPQPRCQATSFGLQVYQVNRNN